MQVTREPGLAQAVGAGVPISAETEERRTYLSQESA